MNLAKKYGPIASKLSIRQYCPPACYELSGKRFELVMDTGYDTGDAVLNFLEETHVEWSIKGTGELKTDKYECRKADDRAILPLQIPAAPILYQEVPRRSSSTARRASAYPRPTPSTVRPSEAAMTGPGAPDAFLMQALK